MLRRITRSASASQARARARRAGTLALCVVLLGSLGCGMGRGRHHPGHHGRHGFTTERDTIQVVSTLVGGKNVFIPSTLVVTSGRPTTLSIYNTTEIPHGFRIPTLDIAEVLPPGEEFEIVLPALEGHQVLAIQCHLHAAHRTATLVVLPGRDGDFRP